MSKISELTTMAQEDLQTFYDVIPILDADTGKVKKITVNTLQGYPVSSNTYANISALCTSDYTIHSAKCKIVSGRLAMVYIVIHNGSTGIPSTVDNMSTENIITLPSSLFTEVYYSGLKTRVLSEVPPTAAYNMIANLPIAVDTNNTVHIVRSAKPWNSSTSWIPSIALNGSGNVKALAIYAFVGLKADVILPYSS